MYTQTHELCKIAVAENGYALRVVENQTEDICNIAVKQNQNAYCFIEINY